MIEVEKVEMTLDEYVCIPNVKDLVVAGTYDKVGGRFRIPEKHEEYIFKLRFREISEAPFLEISEVGISETGMPWKEIVAKMAVIKEK